VLWDDLHAKGVDVKRIGESGRPASDGRQYEWYIRLPGDVDTAVVREALLRHGYSSEHDKGLSGVEPLLEEAVEDLARRLSSAEVGLAAEKRARVAAENRLSRILNDATSARRDRDELQALRARYSERCQDLREKEEELFALRLSTSGGGDVERQASRLRDEIARLQKDNEEVYDYAVDAERSLATVRAQLRDVESLADQRLKNVRDLERHLSSVQQGMADKGQRRGSRGAMDDAEVFLRSLHLFCPGVNLLRDSEDVILRENVALPALFTVLASLQQNGATQALRVKSTTRWMEVRPEGKEKPVRAYWKKTNAGYDVVVSLKRQQARDFDWLARHDK
jgi:ribosomal protein L29